MVVDCATRQSSKIDETCVEMGIFCLICVTCNVYPGRLLCRVPACRRLSWVMKLLSCRDLSVHSFYCLRDVFMEITNLSELELRRRLVRGRGERDLDELVAGLRRFLGRSTELLRSRPRLRAGGVNERERERELERGRRVDLSCLLPWSDGL